MIGIYKITSPSKKVYIGQSVNIEKRFYTYRRNDCKEQSKLYRSFIKYGVENHLFEIINECDISQLNELERYYQDAYSVLSKNGLNLVLTKSSDKSGRVSKESIAKGVKTRDGFIVGDKNPMWGRKGVLNNFFGKKHTEASRKIMSDKNAGKNHPYYGKKRPEHSKAISGERHYNYGKKNKNTSEMNRLRVGDKNPRSKKIIDTITNIIYPSIKEVSDTFNIDQSTLRYRIFRSKKECNFKLFEKL